MDSQSLSTPRSGKTTKKQGKYAEIHGPEAKEKRKHSANRSSSSQIPKLQPDLPSEALLPPQSSSNPFDIQAPNASNPPTLPTDRRKEVIETLLDQLALFLERTESSTAYVQSLQRQVSLSLTTAVEGVEQEKDKIVNKIQGFLTEEKAYLQSIADSKQSILNSILKDFESYMIEVKSAINLLETAAKTSEKYSEAVQNAENIANLSISDPDFPFTWAQISPREFRFSLHKKNHHKNTSSRHKKEGKSSSKEEIRGLMKAYGELETRFKEITPGKKGAEGEKRRLDELESRNKELESRLSYEIDRNLEGSRGKTGVTLSELKSEGRGTGDAGLRLYMSSGEWYCYVKTEEVRSRQSTSVSELLAAVRVQLGLRTEYHLYMRRGTGDREVRLYGSERIGTVVGPVQDAWPRLFLRSLD